mmetsp:Transcript_91408/g.212605  ORF Transcript_91408/g.212605 Transcript_91408/m.212605 type:complete len:332 (-) Transcript_91408:382-1377(-)
MTDQVGSHTPNRKRNVRSMPIAGSASPFSGCIPPAATAACKSLFSNGGPDPSLVSSSSPRVARRDSRSGTYTFNDAKASPQRYLVAMRIASSEFFQPKLSQQSKNFCKLTSLHPYFGIVPLSNNRPTGMRKTFSVESPIAARMKVPPPKKYANVRWRAVCGASPRTARTYLSGVTAETPTPLALKNNLSRLERYVGSGPGAGASGIGQCAALSDLKPVLSTKKKANGKKVAAILRPPSNNAMALRAPVWQWAVAKHRAWAMWSLKMCGSFPSQGATNMPTCGAGCSHARPTCIRYHGMPVAKQVMAMISTNGNQSSQAIPVVKFMRPLATP